MWVRGGGDGGEDQTARRYKWEAETAALVVGSPFFS